MREIPRKLLAVLAKLLPKQKNSGSGAVQVGRAEGDVRVMHVTQYIYAPNAVHQEVPASMPVGRPERRATPRPSAKEAQHQVLALMDHLSDRIAVLEFMAREFGTKMVIDLNSQQLYRLRRYVEAILAAQAKTYGGGP